MPHPFGVSLVSCAAATRTNNNCLDENISTSLARRIHDQDSAKSEETSLYWNFLLRSLYSVLHKQTCCRICAWSRTISLSALSCDLSSSCVHKLCISPFSSFDRDADFLAVHLPWLAGLSAVLNQLFSQSLKNSDMAACSSTRCFSANTKNLRV